MDVEDLQSAYHAALGGLLHREAEIESLVRSQLDLGPDDDWPEPSDDEDDPVSMLYEHAGELDARAKRGAPMVRTAFLIALFHAWERHMNARMKVGKYITANVNAVLVAEGHSAFTETIEHLQLSANCAKHGIGSSGKALFQKRPDLFPGAKTSSEASERKLVITEETLSSFFSAILSVSR